MSILNKLVAGSPGLVLNLKSKLRKAIRGA